jgi:hypothetical protein
MRMAELKDNEEYCVFTLVNFMKSFPSLAKKYY